MGYIAWFKKLENENVGNKATNINRLSEEGFSVPKGFVLTNDAFEEYKNRSKNEIPDNIVSNIETAYNSLNQHKLNDKLRAFDLLKSGENVEVAIRSDEETILNVKGVKQILNSIKDIYNKNLSKNSCQIIIQKMVKCNVSGEIYENVGKIIIKACFGLGQNMNDLGADRYSLNRENNETKIIPAQQTIAYYGGSGRVEEIELGLKKANERKLNNDQMQKLKQIYTNSEDKFGKNIRLKFAIEDNEIFIISLHTDNNYIEKAEPKFYDTIDEFDIKFETKLVQDNPIISKLDLNEENILKDMKEEFREKLNVELIEPDKTSNTDLYEAYREEILREDVETKTNEKKMLEQIDEEEEKEIKEYNTEVDKFEETEKNDEEADLYNYSEIENQTTGEKLSAESIGFKRVPKFEINEYIKNISGENAKIGDIREINELMYDIDEKIEKEKDEENILDWEEPKKEIEEEIELIEEKESKIEKFEDRNKDSLEIHNNKENKEIRRTDDDDFY